MQNVNWLDSNTRAVSASKENVLEKLERTLKSIREMWAGRSANGIVRNHFDKCCQRENTAEPGTKDRLRNVILAILTAAKSVIH